MLISSISIWADFLAKVYYTQLFSTFSMCLYFCSNRKIAKKLLIKCWWNWHPCCPPLMSILFSSQMNYLSTLMESTYSTAKICDFDEDPETCVPSLELEPGTNDDRPSLITLLCFVFNTLNRRLVGSYQYKYFKNVRH